MKQSTSRQLENELFADHLNYKYWCQNLPINYYEKMSIKLINQISIDWLQKLVEQSSFLLRRIFMFFLVVFAAKFRMVLPRLNLFNILKQPNMQYLAIRSGHHGASRPAPTTEQEVYAYKIGTREIVGFGFNGLPTYVDRTDYPFPAIRWREDTAEIRVRTTILYLLIKQLFQIQYILQIFE